MSGTGKSVNWLGSMRGTPPKMSRDTRGEGPWKGVQGPGDRQVQAIKSAA